MATWIAHLRIAEKLLEHIPNIDPAQFAVGNLAPDSGLPDENWENFDPPTAVTHFEISMEDGGTQLEDLRFYRQYLADIPMERDRPRYSFLLGYFFHLLTDNLWRAEIVEYTKKKYPQQFEANPNFIWEVKKDWYGLDFAYVRAHPESLFWKVFIPAEYSENYLEFFPREAIPVQMEYIKKYYQRTDVEIEQRLRLSENVYLTKKEMDAFVESAVAFICFIFDNFLTQELSSKGQKSALEFTKAPYAN